MSDTAETMTEFLTVGVNEAVVMVQDVKFLKGLGIGILLGIAGSCPYNKWLTGASKLTIPIPDDCSQVYQKRQEDTKKAVEKEVLNFLSMKSSK